MIKTLCGNCDYKTTTSTNLQRRNFHPLPETFLKMNCSDLLLNIFATSWGILLGELVTRAALFCDIFFQKKRIWKSFESVFIKRQTQFWVIILLGLLSWLPVRALGHVDYQHCLVVAFVWFLFRTFGMTNSGLEDLSLLEDTHADLGPGLAANYWMSFLQWALKSDISQKMEDYHQDYCKTFGTVVSRSRAFEKFIILLPDDCDLQIRDERILKGNFTLNLLVGGF